MKKFLLGLFLLVSIVASAQIKVSQMPSLGSMVCDTCKVPVIFGGTNYAARGSQLINSPLKATAAGVKFDGTDQAAAINSALSASNVKELVFDNQLAQTVTINSTVTIPAGKSIRFENGNKIIGTGTVSGGYIICDLEKQCFDSTITVTGIENNLISAAWFGAIADTKSDGSIPGGDDHRAIQTALNARKDISSNFLYKFRAKIYLPAPSASSVNNDPMYYRSDSTIIIDQGVEFFGERKQLVTIKFPPGIKGVFVKNADLTGSTYKGAYAPYVHDFTVVGNYGGAGTAADDSSSHGFYIRAYGRYENLGANYFNGDGFNIYAQQIPIAPETIGSNANNSHFENLTGYNNSGSGFHTEGDDANNMTLDNGDFVGNGRWGVWESSFLGNGYKGIHCASNGIYNLFGRSTVFYNGKIYLSKTYNTNIKPEVTAGWQNHWYLWTTGIPSPDTFWPAWDSTKQYKTGGAYQMDGANQYGTFVGCYYEGDQYPGENLARNVILGGILAPNKPGGIWSDGSAVNVTGLRVSGTPIDNVTIDLTAGGQNTIGFNDAGSSITFGFKYVKAGKYFSTSLNNSVGYTSFLSSLYDPSLLGRSTAPRDGSLSVSDRMYFSRDDVGQSRSLAYRSAKPVVGEWVAGDFVVNASGDSTILGWRCIVSGTPGIWKVINSVTTSTGVSTRVPYWNGTANLYNDAQFTFDDVNKIFHVGGTVSLPWAELQNGAMVLNRGSLKIGFSDVSPTAALDITVPGSDGIARFQGWRDAGPVYYPISLNPAGGNVLINTVTNGSGALQVAGDIKSSVHSGYTYNINGSLGATDWVSKQYDDSTGFFGSNNSKTAQNLTHKFNNFDLTLDSSNSFSFLSRGGGWANWGHYIGKIGTATQSLAYIGVSGDNSRSATLKAVINVGVPGNPYASIISRDTLSKISEIRIYGDSLVWTPYAITSRFTLLNLPTFYDTNLYKPMARDYTGRLVQLPYWPGVKVPNFYYKDFIDPGTPFITRAGDDSSIYSRIFRTVAGSSKVTVAEAPVGDSVYKYTVDVNESNFLGGPGGWVSNITALQNYAGLREVLWVSDSLQGGNSFTYVSATRVPDNGTIFSATGKGTGSWVRNFRREDGICAAWWNVTADSSSNSNNTHITDCITYATNNNIKKIKFRGKILLDSGTGALFNLTLNGIELSGEGQGTTKLIYPNVAVNAATQVFQMSGNYQSIHDLSIQNLAQSGSNDWTAIKWADGAFYPKVSRVEIFGIYGNGAAGGSGIASTMSWNTPQYGTTLGSTFSAGAQTATPASMSGIHIGSQLHIAGTAEDVVVTAITQTTFTATYINAHNSTDVVTIYSQGRQYGVIEDVWIHDSWKASAIVLNSSSNEIRGKFVIENIGSTTTQHGIYSQGGNNKIHGGTILGIQGYGIHGHKAVSNIESSGDTYTDVVIGDCRQAAILVDGTTNGSTNTQYPNGAQLNRYNLISFITVRNSLGFLPSSAVPAFDIQSPSRITDCILEDVYTTANEAVIFSAGSAGSVFSHNRMINTNTIPGGGTMKAIKVGVDNVEISDNPYLAFGNSLITGNNCRWINNTLIESKLTVDGNHTQTIGNNSVNATTDAYAIVAGNTHSNNTWDANKLITASTATFGTFDFTNQTNIVFSNNSSVGTTAYLRYTIPNATIEIINHQGGISHNGNAIKQQLRGSGRLMMFPFGASASIVAGNVLKWSAGTLVKVGTGDLVFAAIAPSDFGSSAANGFFNAQPGTPVPVLCTGAWTIGNYAIISTTVAGTLKDGGTTAPAAGTSYGIFLDTGGGTGTATVMLVRTN